jgi:hypothetical protein
MNIQINENSFYKTDSGKLLKVTTHHEHTDEIFGIIYKTDGSIADFFKTDYDGFRSALKE